MIIPIIILATVAGVFLLIYRTISQDKVSKLKALESQRKTAKNKYEFVLDQKRELQKESEEKGKQLITLQNSEEGIKTISLDDLNVEEVDESEKVSRYLLQEGKITAEQNEKVLQKMDILQMDYLGVCMTLGFIDLDTAKRAIKVNKVISRTIAF